MQPSPEPGQRKPSQLARDASTALRKEWLAIVASSSPPSASDQLRDETTARHNMQHAIAAYVGTWREDAATPERMLVDLKSVLNDVTAALEPEMRRAVFEEIVGLAIEEYYRPPSAP